MHALMTFKDAKNDNVFLTDSSLPEKQQVRNMNIQLANSLSPLAVPPRLNLSTCNTCMTEKTASVKAYKTGAPPQRAGQLFGNILPATV